MLLVRTVRVGGVCVAGGLQLTGLWMLGLTRSIQRTGRRRVGVRLRWCGRWLDWCIGTGLLNINMAREASPRLWGP